MNDIDFKIRPNSIPTFGVNILIILKQLCNEVVDFTKKTSKERNLSPRLITFINQKCNEILTRIAIPDYLKNHLLVKTDYITLTELMNTNPPQWIQDVHLTYCCHPETGMLGYWYSKEFSQNGIPIDPVDENDNDVKLTE